MGKSDAIGKELMRNNMYFADAFNAGLFGGEALINPKDLDDVEPAEIELKDSEMGSDEFWAKYRDVLKKALIKTDGKNYFVLLGGRKPDRDTYGDAIAVTFVRYTSLYKTGRRGCCRISETEKRR
ncbi:MAG: hypothetical protein BHW44_00500 [Roseburia sp. 40_7]|nr:MAG: hypothetical protein BHW44_00500 [Roseburia sp. 40_7]